MLRVLMSISLILTVQICQCQDVVYLFDNEKEEGKILEVGVDSISLLKRKNKVLIDARQVHQILFEDGTRFFVPQDIISTVNNTTHFVQIQDTVGTDIFYYDLQNNPDRIRQIRKKEMFSLVFKNGEEVYFHDKIVMINGQTIAADIIEISDTQITFSDPVKTKKKKNVPVAGVEFIRFKSGFQQQFVINEN